MIDSDLENYPYKCAYLSYLWHVELLSGSDILARSLEMQNWLDANCRGTFRWDTLYSKFPLNTSKGTPLHGNNVQQIALANNVYFKNEQDLLAFRLRWGIHDTIALL